MGIWIIDPAGWITDFLWALEGFLIQEIIGILLTVPSLAKNYTDVYKRQPFYSVVAVFKDVHPYLKYVPKTHLGYIIFSFFWPL